MSEKRERICPVCGRSYTDPPRAFTAGQQDGHLPGVRDAGSPGSNSSARDPRRTDAAAVYATGNKWAIENFEATHS